MTTLKGVFPEPKATRRKNFIHENVKNLRRMENYFHSNKEVEELQKLQIQRQQKAADKYQNVTSRVNSSLREARNGDIANSKTLQSNVNQRTENNRETSSKTRGQPNPKISAPALQNKTTNATANQKLSSVKPSSNIKGHRLKRGTREVVFSQQNQQGRETKAPSDPNLNSQRSNPQTQYRNQGIQTLDAKHMSNLYTEGTIRYASRRSPSPRLENAAYRTTELGQQTDMTPREGASSPSDRGDVSPARSTPSPKLPEVELNSLNDEGTDFIKLNKQRTTIAAKMAAQLNNGVPPTHYRKGVVPKYLRERKEAQLQKEQKAKDEASDPDCPEGHVPLPDNERKETLRMLKKNYQEFVNELNMMPIKTDTLRSQRRKMEIEKQLNKIEEGIKVFSRPKVYVKINA